MYLIKIKKVDSFIEALRTARVYLQSKGREPIDEYCNDYLDYISILENNQDLNCLEPLIKSHLTRPIMASIPFKDWYKNLFDLKTVVDPKEKTILDAVKAPLTYAKIREFAATSLSIEDLAEFYQVIILDTAYKGFDPKTMVTILRALHEASGDYNEESDNFYNDMVFLIILFLQRGTSVVDKTKIGTMSQEAKKRVAFLKKKYGLIAKIEKADKSTAITLSRVAACFPTVVCQIMYAAEIQRPVSAESMAGIYPGFPVFLRNSCWFSIFYEKGPYLGILKALLHYQIMEGTTINTKNAEYRAKPLEEKMEEAIKYGAAAFKSELVLLDDRRALCLRYFRGVTSAAQRTWSARFDDIFPTAIANLDQYFDMVLPPT